MNSVVRRWRSLLPLVLVFGLSFLSFLVPAFLLPGRNDKFFEKHFADYEKAVHVFSEKPGDLRRLARMVPEEDEVTEVRYLSARLNLPRGLKHLSDDGRIWIETSGQHINYFFMYHHSPGDLNGVVYAPDGQIIIWNWDVHPEALKGHPGWYSIWF